MSDTSGMWIHSEYPASGEKSIYCSKCKEEFFNTDVEYLIECPKCKAKMRTFTKFMQKKRKDV